MSRYSILMVWKTFFFDIFSVPARFELGALYPKDGFYILMVSLAEPSRNSQFFPTALLIHSIVHLFSPCITSLCVSIKENSTQKYCKETFYELFEKKARGGCWLKSCVANFPFVFLSVRWLEIFPREQLLLVNGDQLIEDPLSQIRRIEDFLGSYLALTNKCCISSLPLSHPVLPL